MEKSLELLEFHKVLEMLAARVATPLGRELVEDLRPVSSLKLVQRWQQETTEGCTLLGKTSPALHGITDLRPLLLRVEKGGLLTGPQLREVGENLAAFKRVKDQLLKYAGGVFQSLAGDVDTLPVLAKALLESLDQEGGMLDGASPALSSLRREIHVSRGRVQREIERVMKSSSLSRYLQENLVTQRNGRYVFPFKVEHKSQVPGIVHDYSASGATVFIEPLALVEANNRLNNLKSREQKEIDRVLAELSDRVAGAGEAIRESLNTLAEIDFILAKARLGLDLGGNEPLLNEKGYFRLAQARHPLLKDPVVPIDVELGRKHHTMVITGPNTGGKTVTLKTIGLLTLMGQSGLHLPANPGTEISIFDRVFADIGDEQNIEQSLSTFSGHLKNIIGITRGATSRSLVLLDELGAGTDPAEGSALAMGILDHFHDLQARTVATTHYGSLKSFAYDHDQMENASVEFDPRTLEPTFRLLQGIAGSSNAFEIALRLGLDREIIQGARAYLGEEELKLRRLMENLEESQRKIRWHQKSMEEDRARVEELGRLLEEEKALLMERKKKILQKAREEALLIVNQARRHTEEVIQQVEKRAREQEARQRSQVYREALENLKEEKEEILEKMEAEERVAISPLQPQELKPGETVFIKSLKQQGKIIEISGPGEVTVQAGIIKVTTGIQDLARATGGAAGESSPRPQGSYSLGGLSLQKSQQTRHQLDLRGEKLEEATARVEKYLDDAYLGGLKTVYLIHGKGTGALKNGLHRYLEKHRQVDSFQLAGLKEGGSGVTIVTLG